MFNTFRTAIVGFIAMFRNDTVDSIVASINEQVDRLNAVAAAAQEHARNCYAAADQLESEADDAVDNATRAARVAGNLSSLIYRSN